MGEGAAPYLRKLDEDPDYLRDCGRFFRERRINHFGREWKEFLDALPVERMISDPRTFRRFENGEGVPKDYTLEMIYRALGFDDLEAFFGEFERWRGKDAPPGVPRGIVKPLRPARAVAAAGALPVGVRSFAKLIGAGPSEAILELARRRRIDHPKGFDHFLDLWLDADVNGVLFENVFTHPVIETSRVPATGVPREAGLARLPKELVGAFQSHFADIPEKARGEESKPKVWVTKWEAAHDDRRRVDLYLGASDYFHTKGYEAAMEKPSRLAAGVELPPLLDRFHSGEWDFEEHLYGILVAHVMVVTADRHLVLLQASKSKGFNQALRWSPSLEEHFDPHEDCDGKAHLRRALEKELRLGEDYRNDAAIDWDEVKCVAFGREWGRVWHTPIVWHVPLHLTAAEFAANVNQGSSDGGEIKGVVCVPMDEPAGRRLLFEAVRDDRLDLAAADARGVRLVRAMNPASAPLHRSTGRARLALALWKWGTMDRESLFAEAVEFSRGGHGAR